jgi:hypothetical protein
MTVLKRLKDLLGALNRLADRLGASFAASNPGVIGLSAGLYTVEVAFSQTTERDSAVVFSRCESRSGPANNSGASCAGSNCPITSVPLGALREIGVARMSLHQKSQIMNASERFPRPRVKR